MNPALIPSCLLLCLSACASAPQVLKAQPPRGLLSATPVPALAAPTYGGAIEYAAELKCALQRANEDKRALTAWADGTDYSPGAGCSQ